MTQEDKELLLKDLCGRLPYNTIVSIAEGCVDGIKWNKEVLNTHLLYQIEEEGSWEFVKPYLRPMSNMTEEERKEYINTFEKDVFGKQTNIKSIKTFDWLNKKMFDYRGLIPMGLAIEAPEGMYGKEVEK